MLKLTFEHRLKQYILILLYRHNTQACKLLYLNINGESKQPIIIYTTLSLIKSHCYKFVEVVFIVLS